MLVVETSAIVAIAKNEFESRSFFRIIERERQRICLPATCFVEAVMVFRGYPIQRRWLDEFIANNRITVVPITEHTSRLAADAFERYGRGSGHPARLNFGDCLSYAVAKELDAPLLFKGADFAHTDVKRAL